MPRSWAIAQGIANRDRICIYGASYGGYAALMGVAKEPDLYRCAVGYVGVYDLPTHAGRRQARDSTALGNWSTDWVGKRENLGSVSPNRIADRIKVPVFLAAGGEDERAPIEHSKMMEQALRKAGVPVETLYYRHRRPRLLPVEHQREYYTRLLAFLLAQPRRRSGGDRNAARPTSAQVSRQRCNEGGAAKAAALL